MRCMTAIDLQTWKTCDRDVAKEERKRAKLEAKMAKKIANGPGDVIDLLDDD